MAAEVSEVEGGETTPLKGIRRAAARQMIRAWEAPMFTLSVVVDMANVLAKKLPGTTVTDRLVAAAATTLVQHPALNAWYADEAVTTFEHAHVGIAVATDAGLVVPVVHNAHSLDLEGIAAARKSAVAKAREGKLGFADISGGTFTISNLGMQGIDRFTAIVNVPQVAILAVGATTERFVRKDGVEQWRPQAEFTISCDHRAVDGAMAAAFLADFRSAVEAD